MNTAINYTKIPNSLLDALASTKLSGHEYRLLLFIIRKTYGYHKPEDQISLSQIVDGTGIHRRSVQKVIEKTSARSILQVEGNGQGRPNTLGVNENTSEWKGAPETRISAKTRSGVSAHTRSEVSANTRTTKEKKERKESQPSADAHRLAASLFEVVRARHPHIARNQPGLHKWAKDIDLLIQIDKAPPDEIESVIQWIRDDKGDDAGEWKGWGHVIQSAGSLRKNYSKILSAMKSTNGKQSQTMRRHGQMIN